MNRPVRTAALATPAAPGADSLPLVQHRCACGCAASPLTEQCEECRKQHLGLPAQPRDTRSLGTPEPPATPPAERPGMPLPAAALSAVRVMAGSRAQPAETRRPAPVAALEREAQALADGRPRVPVPTLRPAIAPSSAERRLAGVARGEAHQSLPPALRRDLEARLAMPLEAVRIHAGPQANAVARSLGARAWSFGNHIGFSHGAFAPGTTAGRTLIAHEAAHVAQQRGAAPALLCDAPQGVGFHFSVSVSEEMNADALLLEFVRQYSGLGSREAAEAARDAGNWHWSGTPQTATADDVARGYVLIRVRDRGLSPTTTEERRSVRRTVAGMGAGERADLNAEVDRRFWERSHYREGERLGRSEDDRRMAEYWLLIRDNLVQTRQSIQQLPEHVRALLFDPEASRRLSPTDYETALRVGQKLADMSATELAQWQSRITATTDDWATFEASLDAYLAEEAEHHREQLELGRMATRLYGLEALYELRGRYRAAEGLAAMPSHDEFGVQDTVITETRSELPGLRRELDAALRQNGFSSLAEFEAAILAWRQGFERETVRVADLMLDQLDHMLFEAQTRYTDPAQARALAAAVSASGAPTHYATADRQTSRAIALSAPASAMTERAIDEEGAFAAASASVEAEDAGRAAMQGLGGNHPLLGFPDFPLGELARAGADEVQAIMLEYIGEHREAVRDTRAEIHADRNYIYRLDALLAASQEAQGIEADSIYARIVHDHMAERQLVALVEGLAVAVIAIALGVVTFGGGTLAVGAGAIAVGISAWQAMEAFRTYLRDEDAHDAQLLSEDPSIGWVVLACVGAAADLGAAVAAVRAIRPLAVAFNETGDVAAFRRAVQALPGLDSRIERAVLQGVEAQAGLRRQMQAIAAIGHRANDIIGVVAEGGFRLMIVAWHGARRGFARFDQFLAELQRARIIASISELSPAELQALRGPFDEGLRRALEGFVPRSAVSAELRAAVPADVMDEAAAFGRSLGLNDEAALEVLETQARVAREADPAAITPDGLRQAMRERASVAPDARGATAELAETMTDEATAAGRATMPDELSPATGPGGGGYSRAQLGGDVGEATEAAGAGATALPPTYAQHISRASRDDLREIFSTYGDDALRVFADRLVLPADGLRQVEIPTGAGLRIVDRMFEDGGQIVLREIKRYIHQVLARTSRISDELAKDVALLERYSYVIVDWHLIGQVRGDFLDELMALATRFPGRFRVAFADASILRSFPRGALSRGSEAADALARDLATLAQQPQAMVAWSISRRRIDADFLADLRAAQARFPYRFSLNLNDITEVPTP